MKKVELTINEFLNFKALAQKSGIVFFCVITEACTYIVEAPSDFLTTLGF